MRQSALALGKTQEGDAMRCLIRIGDVGTGSIRWVLV